MAQVLHVAYRPQAVAVKNGVVHFQSMDLPASNSPMLIKSMPVLAWSDGRLWDEANLYLSYRAESIVSGNLSIETLQSTAWALRDFAAFLEANSLLWYEFGSARRDRPTNLYRGHLIDKRNQQKLSASTASARMAKVVQFYRWMHKKGVFVADYPAFTARAVKLRIEDKFGFERSMTVESTDLHIPNRSRTGSRLEDGLHPVSTSIRDRILEAAYEHCSEELGLMLQLGFFTGMRLQSILDLKLGTIEDAIQAETDRGCYLRIGPRYGVATKFGVDGKVFIPVLLLDKLKRYSRSRRRLTREALASPEDQKLVFINRFGRRYGRRGEDRAPSVNVDMGRLRVILRQEGVDVDSFTFHCTRATFGTQIVVAGMQRPGISTSAILERLRTLMLHRSVATSMRYIKYVEDMKVQAVVEEAFDAWMFG